MNGFAIEPTLNVVRGVIGRPSSTRALEHALHIEKLLSEVLPHDEEEANGEVEASDAADEENESEKDED